MSWCCVVIPAIRGGQGDVEEMDSREVPLAEMNPLLQSSLQPLYTMSPHALGTAGHSSPTLGPSLSASTLLASHTVRVKAACIT